MTKREAKKLVCHALWNWLGEDLELDLCEADSQQIRRARKELEREMGRRSFGAEEILARIRRRTL